VRDFTAAETQRDLGLIAIFQKANQAAEFYLIIAIVGTRTASGVVAQSARSQPG
jgi:hypothetical protein